VAVVPVTVREQPVADAGHRDEEEELGASDSEESSPVAISSRDPVWGKRDAPITIVEWADFQCPFSARVEATLHQIRTTYGPETIRIVWKNDPLPFHPNAMPAAEAAMGVFALAGSDAFWNWHDLAFKSQDALAPDSYKAWAEGAGVAAREIPRFVAGLDAHAWGDKVDKDIAEAKSLGSRGTPAFFINGVTVSGAQPFEKFKVTIDEELLKAQAKIASGTPKSEIYVAMSTENRANLPPPSPEPPPAKDDTTTVFKVPLGTSPRRWSTKPLVTIVTFSDFQCPFCKRVQATLTRLHDTYGDKLALVWKNEPLPFHPDAEPAAEVALEALSEKGGGGFWAAHDKLFESQPKLEDADLAAIAQDLGLDAKKVDRAIKTHKWKSILDDDATLSEALRATGTPHFFIDGRRLVGAQPFEKFQAIIDEEITKATALLAKGIPQRSLYEMMQRGASDGPPLDMKPMPAIAGAPWKGGRSAKVTVVEFADFQCPFCVRAEASVAQLMKDYGDRIKLVWRNLPLSLHADASLAAQAAMEAYEQKGEPGFFRMHDKLYANQQAKDGLKRPALDGYAQEIGLDMVKFDAALDSQSHKPQVDADAKMASDEGIVGTPAFVINGYFVNGAQPYATFRRAVERALSEAK
jgi:protein-disulfide isomerase